MAILRHTRPWQLASVAVIAVAAGIAVALAVSAQSGGDKQRGVVDFTSITPISVRGLPSETPNYPPRTETAPHCQAAPDEQPDPKLPSLSCRSTASEPPVGAINTPGPGEGPKSGVISSTPDGWTVIDNRLFRYSVAIPPGWYSNMRDEGGAFEVYDPLTAQASAGRVHPTGGVRISFEARLAFPDVDSGGIPLFPEEKLRNPSTDFGGIPGVIWEEGPGEDLARIIHAAFVKDGVLFEAYAEIVKSALGTSASDDAAAKQAMDVIATLAPY